MFYYKIHKTEFGTLIAVCDNELSGKTLQNKKLEIFVNPRFYGNEQIGEEIMELINNSNDGNVIGNNIVNLLLKNRVITKNKVIKINGIAYAQFSVL
jgi:hypothetical protein